jgi:hypothetical protein
MSKWLGDDDVAALDRGLENPTRVSLCCHGPFRGPDG